MRSTWNAAVLLLAAMGCGDDGGASMGDAGRDAGPGETIDFTAEADPEERTDCMSEAPADGVAVAKHVACDDELLRGTVAMGREGDIVLANARVRYVVRGGESSATTIGAYAGGVVDAGPHGGVDVIKEILPALDISAIRPEAIVVTDAGGDGDARVRVVFSLAPVGLIAALVPGLSAGPAARGVVDYELGGDADALRVSVQLMPAEGSPGGSGRPNLLALMGAAELWQPGRERLEPDGGPGGDGRSLLLAERPGGAVAIRMLPGEGSVSHAASINLVTGGERASLRPGTVVRFEGLVGAARTAAGAWNAVHAGDEGLAVLTLRGAAGDRVRIVDAEDAILLRTTLEADGETEVRLPPGDYTVVPGFDGFFEGEPVSVTLADDGASLDVTPAPRGTLRVEPTADGATDAPVRVTLARDGEEVDRRVAVGAGEWSLPPGPWTVTVSRGMEYDFVQQDLTVVEDDTVTLVAALDRVVDTTGWVAGDFHLHSELSTDSTHHVVDALRIIAGEGLEVVASSDHDHLAEYPRFVDEAGVGDWLVAVTGLEASPAPLLHANGYPLAPDASMAGNGAVEWFDMTPSEIFDALRARGDAALGGGVVQVNHPSMEGAGLFLTVGLDPETGHATAVPTDLGLPAGTDLDDFDFDAVEVLNGTSGSDETADTLAAMLALWAAGRPFTFMGNSDSHGPTSPAGSPRTYLRVADDSPGAYDFAEVADAIRSGDVTLASGIFVTAAIDGPVSGDSVPVAVRVQAPPWIEVDRLRVWAGREATVDRALTDSGAPIRLDETIDVPLGGASFVVVHVTGTGRTDPVQSEAPVGITNPLPVE